MTVKEQIQSIVDSGWNGWKGSTYTSKGKQILDLVLARLVIEKKEVNYFGDDKEYIQGYNTCVNKLETLKAKMLEEDEEVCEYCGGTGEVSVMETVYAGEPHQAPTGTQKCICKIETE